MDIDTYYPKLIVISPDNKHNDYSTFISKLKAAKIINSNKLWDTDNTCVIYNCPSLQQDKHNNKYNMEKIFNRYNKLKMSESERNNKIILLYHKQISDVIEPLHIGDVYIIHNSYLCKLLNESTANIKNCSINNVFQYINKFLNNALLKNNINKQIIKSRNMNKKCNMYWLNKVIILYDYINSTNKLVDINVPKGNNGILQILNNNQFMII